MSNQANQTQRESGEPRIVADCWTCADTVGMGNGYLRSVELAGRHRAAGHDVRTVADNRIESPEAARKETR